MATPRPAPFLEVRCTIPSGYGDDHALCAGFELDEWRRDQLAEHLMEWLPEFALRHHELQELGAHNAVALIKKAARTIYATEKYSKRGEFGELLLHVALRQIYGTEPAISKIFYKNAMNKTVEGFDAVHIVANDRDGLELWIGETKFYSDINRAIRDVSAEIVRHLDRDYLRSEFILISNKIDDEWPYAESLKELLHKNTPLDKVFERACIPILLTYDSNAVRASKSVCSNYVSLLRNETATAVESLRAKLVSQYKAKFRRELPVRVHIVLVPLHTKASLAKRLHEQLRSFR